MSISPDSLQKHSSFTRDCADNGSEVVVNTTVISDWLNGKWDQKPPAELVLGRFFLKCVPALMMIVMSGFAIVSQRWLLLAVLPLVPLVLLALSPTTIEHKILNHRVLTITMGLLLSWSICSLDLDRSLIMLTLLICWRAQVAGFDLGCKSFFSSLFSNASFFDSACNRSAFATKFAGSETRVAPSGQITDMPASTTIELNARFSGNSQIIVSKENASTSAASSLDIVKDEEALSRVDQRAMAIVMNYEMRSERVPEDVSMYYVGFDVQSRDLAGGLSRSIEVKGKATQGSIIITANEWATAQRLGDSYFLYIVEHVFSAQPRIRVIQNPAQKLVPAVNKVQYILNRANYVGNGTICDISQIAGA